MPIHQGLEVNDGHGVCGFEEDLVRGDGERTKEERGREGGEFFVVASVVAGGGGRRHSGGDGGGWVWV
jgi:hypothetical protein